MSLKRDGFSVAGGMCYEMTAFEIYV